MSGVLSNYRCETRVVNENEENNWKLWKYENRGKLTMMW